jgi:hypothetical protein
MKINSSNAPFVLIALNKNLLSISTKNVFMKAMHFTKVNFVIKDLMEKTFSIGILNQFMREINHIKKPLEYDICGKRFQLMSTLKQQL